MSAERSSPREFSASSRTAFPVPRLRSGPFQHEAGLRRFKILGGGRTNKGKEDASESQPLETWHFFRQKGPGPFGLVFSSVTNCQLNNAYDGWCGFSKNHFKKSGFPLNSLIDIKILQGYSPGHCRLFHDSKPPVPSKNLLFEFLRDFIFQPVTL